MHEKGMKRTVECCLTAYDASDTPGPVKSGEKVRLKGMSIFDAKEGLIAEWVATVQIMNPVSPPLGNG
jgi:hypothetical protein